MTLWISIIQKCTLTIIFVSFIRKSNLKLEWKFQNFIFKIIFWIFAIQKNIPKFLPKIDTEKFSEFTLPIFWPQIKIPFDIYLLVMSTIISIICKPKETFGTFFLGGCSFQAAKYNICIWMICFHMREKIFPFGRFWFLELFSTALYRTGIHVHVTGASWLSGETDDWRFFRGRL